jgi:RNA recognition motif-containing protein
MRLHIGNLSKDVTDTQLSDLITTIAKPTTLQIIRDRDGSSKGFGFAEFATDDEARAVITGMSGREVEGKTLQVGEARPRRNEAAAQGGQR